MSFYNPLGFLTLLTIPVIIFLYLLKQKHPEYPVSSLLLWSEALKDIEAISPWQKLRKNILLILQIIAMLLLALALSRPYLNDVAGKSENVLIILDTSMSMQANDISPSRFEAAKKQAANYISNLKPDTMVTLLSMGSSVVIEENQNRDKNSILEKLKAIKVSNTAANTEDAITTIQSIVRQYPETEAALFSDNKLQVPGIALKYYDFSGSADNYAMTLVSHSTGKGLVTVLSRVANFTKADKSIPVSLYVDGKVYDAKNVEVKAGETADVYWSGIPLKALYIECRIVIKDGLDADNSGWDAINPAGISKILLVSNKNLFIEKAIGLLKDYELYRANPDVNEEYRGYSLYIFDGFIPDKLPSDGSIMVFNPTSNNNFTLSGEVKLPTVKKSSHPIFNYIDDYGFTIGKTSIMEVPKWGEAVLDSDKGNLIFTGTLQNRRLMVLGFDIHNTDMALRPMFPILISNSLEWLIPSKIKNIDNVTAGQSISFNLNPKSEQVRVKTPSEKFIGVAPPFPAQIFSNTEEIGLYSLEQKHAEGTSTHYFAVNPPSAAESNLLEKTNKTGATHEAGLNTKESQKGTGYNLQNIILWALLVLLLLEWWVYSHEI